MTTAIRLTKRLHAKCRWNVLRKPLEVLSLLSGKNQLPFTSNGSDLVRRKMKHHVGLMLNCPAKLKTIRKGREAPKKCKNCDQRELGGSSHNE